MTDYPLHQVRAVHDARTIRVYQAYNDAIADSALKRGTFVSPPFSMTRMTWIKPSFLWMVYRAGWGFKDPGQNRILALDITREGFDWALDHACLSHPPEGMADADWEAMKAAHPVRIQWDPERDLHNPLPHRAIQVGIRDQAVARYVNEWIVGVTDVTPIAHEVHGLVQAGRLEEARAILPVETAYPLDPGSATGRRLKVSEG